MVYGSPGGWKQSVRHMDAAKEQGKLIEQQVDLEVL